MHQASVSFVFLEAVITGSPSAAGNGVQQPETDTGQTGHCSALSLVIGVSTFPVRNKDYKSFVSSSDIVSGEY